jgi:hypothetical protein
VHHSEVCRAALHGVTTSIVKPADETAHEQRNCDLLLRVALNVFEPGGVVE